MKLNMNELHAFAIGFFEVLCPWKARYIPLHQPPSPIEGEEHYYLAGRGAGFIALLLILVGLIKLVKEG